jgi:hypothetical protein
MPSLGRGLVRGKVDFSNQRATTMRNLLFAAHATVFALLVVTSAVQAQATHPRQTPEAQAPEITGGNLLLCRMGFDTQTATITPPDDSVEDNPPAGSVTFTKDCAGNVIGRFSAEANTPAAGDFIHLTLRATCVGAGGQASPCTLGQQVTGAPGHTFFRNSVGLIQVNAVQVVWPALKRGRWLFEVLPGGNNSANLQFRTFVVEAYSNQ